MGFLDNVTSAVNRGTAAAGRGADKIKLSARIGELNKQRQGLAAQLGASLYEATRGDAALVAGREALYEGIVRVDAEREECQRQIAAIDEQAAAAATAAAGFTCAVCGARMSGADLFCSGCGTPADKARAQVAPARAVPTGPACASCGAPLGEGDMFCMSCGAKVAPHAVCAGAGIGDAELIENAGVGASELVEVDGDGNKVVAPGGEGAPKGGE
ncbi:zinc-ribbon domain-containing protein [Adlercreutzia sp. R21]|uniref:zinc-ribbon domain-containing protein n=1 Tax=Adlercreutzia wanghongyangiae TaxID=3111451 RepID=UPI002DBD9386|nr:zinc-ribbon domain-containing protein [Adlercreutzia sp. R21]MEC4184973.1 zinc-ribbon domain-containing protein [Adlercreutzia sp. R21]